jgi:hypothetical protein
MSSRRRLILWIGLLSGIAFLLKTYADQRHSVFLRDFKQPYASARCVAYGCDPYSEADTQRIFIQAGGNPAEDTHVFVPYSALYPPPSLYLMEPIGMLPYPLAARVWMTLNGLAYCAAILVMAQWCAAFDGLAASLVLALFAVTSTIILGLGQVSCLSISLLVIGMGCILNRRFAVVGVGCVAISILLKPHLAGVVPLYLMFSGRERIRRYVQIVSVGVLFCAIVMGWSVLAKPGVSHWIAEWRANIAGNMGSGATNDPSPHGSGGTSSASLQALTSLFISDARDYRLAAYGVTAALLLAWACAVRRMRAGLERDVIAIAALAAIGLLPVYHRMYDTRILLFLFPAVAALSRKSRSWRVVSIGAALVITLLSSMQWQRCLGVLFTYFRAPSGRAADVLLYRPIAQATLLAACFLTAAFLAAAWKQNRCSSEVDPTEQRESIPA